MVATRSEIMERMRTAFRAEALDLLPELDAALLAMEMEPNNAALVNRVFRAMHTIKGSGATAGFTHLAHFAHRVEEAFDLARSGRLPITSELIDCGLQACDVIREILDMEDEERQASGERTVTEAIAQLLPHTHSTPPQAPMTVEPRPALTAYEIVFRPNIDLFRSGTDPLSLLDELRDLGTTRITAHTNVLPSLANLDPESCYLWWHVLLVTECGEDAIRDVFLFIEDDCDIDIRILPSQPESIVFLRLPRQEQLPALRRLTYAYLAIADASLKRMDTSPGDAMEEIPAYIQAMQRLSATALCSLRYDLEDSAMLQSRILARLSRVARPASSQDRFRLHEALAVLHQAIGKTAAEDKGRA